MKRFALAACGGALLATLSLARASSWGEPPDALVYDAMAAPASVSYTGVAESLRIGDDGSQVSVYRIEHRAPNRTIRRYTAPPALLGDALVTVGDENFSIDAAHHRIVERRNDAIDDQIAIDDNYLLLRQNYRAVRRASESFDGRDVNDVALVNNYTHRTTMLVRVDARRKLVLDKQRFAADGSMIAETRFEQIHYASGLPLSDFALPKGYAIVHATRFGSPSVDPQRVAARAGFAAREPRFLPDGFSPVEGSIVTLQGVRTLHVLYSDGLRTVSLFENDGPAAVNMKRFHPQATSLAGRRAQYAEDGPTTLLTWRGTSLQYALVGELQLTELKRIAASVEP
jgi:negative regulator of sigma E activity